MSPINGGFIRGTEERDNLLVGDFHFTDTETLDESQDLVKFNALSQNRSLSLKVIEFAIWHNFCF